MAKGSYFNLLPNELKYETLSAPSKQKVSAGKIMNEKMSKESASVSILYLKRLFPWESYVIFTFLILGPLATKLIKHQLPLSYYLAISVFWLLKALNISRINRD